MYAFDVAHFAAFAPIKLVESATLKLAITQQRKSIVDVLQRVRLVALRACFPTDTAAALTKTVIKVVKRENLFVVVAIGV